MRYFTNYMRAFDGGILAPYPVEKLKRVDRPTVLINEEKIKRVDQREGGFNKARRGDYGPKYQNKLGRFKYPISHAQNRMAQSFAKLVDGEVAGHLAPDTNDPVVMAKHIKALTYFLRADIVGICKLPPYAVFSHSSATGEPIDLKHKYAIAIVVDQDWKTSSASYGNDWISTSMGYLAYSNSAFISVMLADYIRRLGYPARAHHVTDYQVAVSPILLWAGLGEMCRAGDVVLNPFLGTRFKAAIVTTDLPLAIDKPIDFGLQDFCSKCEKCAKYCPSGAISFGKDTRIMHNGYQKWDLDVKKCTQQRIGNKLGSGCSVCIQVCPWNKPYTPFHRFIQWTMINIPFARRFAVWGDDLLGYGKPDLKYKWWFDLVHEEGRLQIPKVDIEKGKNRYRSNNNNAIDD